MQIFVKLLNGKTITLQVEESDLVTDVKAKIEEKEGIQFICRQKLVNGHKILEDNEKSLSFYGVSNESTLQMLLRDCAYVALLSTIAPPAFSAVTPSTDKSTSSASKLRIPSGGATPTLKQRQHSAQAEIKKTHESTILKQLQESPLLASVEPFEGFEDEGEISEETGKEDENILFEERSKLFRYAEDTKEWKERCRGQAKLLQNKMTGNVRFIMQQEQTFNICANHNIVPGSKMDQIKGSTKARAWNADDFADKDKKTETFCIRFNTEEQAEEFNAKFEMAKFNILAQFATTQKNVEEEIENNNDKKEACETFQDKLVKSMTFEMNREIENRTKSFSKLEEQRIEIDMKLSELKAKRDRNMMECEERKKQQMEYNGASWEDFNEVQRKKSLIDKKIKEMQNESINLELKIKEISKKWKDAAEEYSFKNRQTDAEYNKIEEEMGSLKKTRADIENAKNTLFKKKKVNEDLVEFISNTIEKKKKDLECPVCLETAETPIYKCSMDHLVCKICLPKLEICPEYRKQYSKSPVHHRFAEKLDEEIKELSMELKTLLDEV